MSYVLPHTGVTPSTSATVAIVSVRISLPAMAKNARISGTKDGKEICGFAKLRRSAMIDAAILLNALSLHSMGWRVAEEKAVALNDASHGRGRNAEITDGLQAVGNVLLARMRIGDPTLLNEGDNNGILPALAHRIRTARVFLQRLRIVRIEPALPSHECRSSYAEVPTCQRYIPIVLRGKQKPRESEPCRAAQSKRARTMQHTPDDLPAWKALLHVCLFCVNA